MNSVLNALVARSGVNAAFLCDSDGELLGSALSEIRYQTAVDALREVIGRTNTSLLTLKHGNLGESEWVYDSARILIRGIEQNLLCLICERSVNLQLLTMKIDEIHSQIHSAVGTIAPPPSELDLAGIKQEMISVAEEVLGEHSDKVVAVLRNSEQSISSLEQACDQAEKITRLFIDRKNASELGARLRSLLDQ